MPAPVKFLLRHCLLATAAALLSYGLIAWHERGMAIDGMLLYDNHWRPHPLHLLVLGICMLPLAMRGIFVLDARQQARTREAANVPEAEPEDG